MKKGNSMEFTKKKKKEIKEINIHREKFLEIFFKEFLLPKYSLTYSVSFWHIYIYIYIYIYAGGLKISLDE